MALDGVKFSDFFKNLPMASESEAESSEVMVLTQDELKRLKGLTDAPSDDKAYARKNGAWEEVEGGGAAGAAGLDFCINGGFSIWQKGISFDVGSENSITADMWRVNSYIRDGETPLTRFLVSKDYDSPANLLTQCCVKIMPKESVPSLTGDVEGHIRQGIDGLRFKTIFGKKLVCSFWVKSNFPGVYSITCVNYAMTKSYTKEYTINQADTWEYKELVFSFENLNPSDWEFGNSGAVRFRFELYNNGDVVSPSNDTWLDGNYCGSQNQVNFIESNSNYFKLAQVKFEVNPSNKATPYVQKLDSVELLSCQRFYQLIPLSMDFNATGSGQYYSVTLPTFTNMLKEPICSVVNDIASRQSVGGYAMAYPGDNQSAAKDVQLSPLAFINAPVQTTDADNLIHSIRARFISKGSGRNALNDLLVELDATI